MEGFASSAGCSWLRGAEKKDGVVYWLLCASMASPLKQDNCVLHKKQVCRDLNLLLEQALDSVRPLLMISVPHFG